MSSDPALSIPTPDPDIQTMPDLVSVYVAPTKIPQPTNHQTFELETVQVASEVDPRRAPTIVLPRVVAPSVPPHAAEDEVPSRRARPASPAGVSLWFVAALAGFALVSGSAAARMILIYTAPQPTMITATSIAPVAIPTAPGAPVVEAQSPAKDESTAPLASATEPAEAAPAPTPTMREERTANTRPTPRTVEASPPATTTERGRIF
ncbi:MAG: hypothetical protein JW751_00980 [Polyangiaceae bacterium]|nr:hypothetical protein [Polyangiaceae bacterium]